MWVEYVRLALSKGQQVFRSSVIRNLMEEIDAGIGVGDGDSAEVANLKHQLAIEHKRVMDLNRMLHNAQAINERNANAERPKE